jgi:hypothetical protein
VVQVKKSENLIVTTSPDLRTNKVTVINMQDIPMDLVPLPSNVWSLQDLLPGVYNLNVNVAMSSSGIQGTYETILVILEPDQQPLPPTMIINQMTIRPPGGGCPGNLTLIEGECMQPSPPPPISPGPCPTPSITPCPTPPVSPPVSPPVTPPEEGEEPPPEEVPPDSDDATNGNGNDNGNDNGNGEDGSNGDGEDNEGGEEGSSPVPPFG